VPQLNGNHNGVSRLLEHTKVLSSKENGNERKPKAAWHRIDEEGKQNAPLVEAFRACERRSCFPPPIIRPVRCSSRARSPGRQDHDRHEPGNRSGTSRPTGLACGCRFAVTFAAPVVRNTRELGLVSYLTGIRIGALSCVRRGPRVSISCFAAHTSQSIGTSLFPKHGRIDSFRTRTIRLCDSRFGAHAGARGQPHSCDARKWRAVVVKNAMILANR